MKLAKQYQSMEIFQIVRGQCHWRFPGFPKSVLSNLNMVDMKKWINKKTRDFQRKNIYRQDNIIVDI